MIEEPRLSESAAHEEIKRLRAELRAAVGALYAIAKVEPRMVRTVDGRMDLVAASQVCSVRDKARQMLRSLNPEGK